MAAEKRILSDEAKRMKATYDMDYAHKHITRKLIPFNRDVPEDARMLEWLDAKNNITGYVKGLIREDMEKTGK